MKKNFTIASWLALVALAILNLQPSIAFAQGTAFTYNGRLNDGTNPATGSYDLRFTLYTAATGGTLSGALTNTATGITNGLFTVTLDFGGVFNGANYWLELAARTNGGGAFSPLSPRQPVMPAPYAIYSANAGTAATASSASSVAAANITGIVPLAQLPTAVVTNNGNFTAGNITINSNLDLPVTTAMCGIIYAEGYTLLHTYGAASFFAGIGAGNLTMSTYYGYNTAVGYYSFHNNVDGSYNTAIGYEALQNNTNGSFNTANGAGALQGNTSGSYNTGSGSLALYGNTSGSGNTADGWDALTLNTTGNNNTAVGLGALRNNTTGNGNIAIGISALISNTNGLDNVANGQVALFFNTSGSFNTANGASAIYHNGTGSYNTANGFEALFNSATGSNNIALGYQAGYNIITGSSNIDIGNMGLVTDTNIIRIGSSQTQTFIAGVITGDGSGLTNLNAGQLPSSVLTNNENGVTLSGTFNGNGGGLTNLNVSAAQLTGTAGNFSAESITISSNLYLPGTSATAGIIYSGGERLIHTYGFQNFFAGVDAGNLTMRGADNTGNGDGALQNNTTGSENTASGWYALVANTSGSDNAANGMGALAENSSGAYNTANGAQALFSNTTGSNNIALGYQAGYNITTGSSNIDIGNMGLATDTNIIRIGTSQTATYLVGTVYASGVALSSDRNAKENFTAVDAREVLAKVTSLPVTEWNYRTDSKKVQHIGPMAQDFQAAFGLDGMDDKHISVVDEGGVALAAIQGLNQKLESSVKEKDAEIQELRARLEKLEQFLVAKNGGRK
jgi:hypothetical protein